MTNPVKHNFTTQEIEDLVVKFPTYRHFMGSVFGDNESEQIVIQALQACKRNLESRGEAFSFRGKGVSVADPTQVEDFGTHYGDLVHGGYLIEEKRTAADLKVDPKDLDLDGEGFATILFISDRLFNVLRSHR